MNTFTRHAFAALVLAGAVVAPASANVQQDVQQAISEGNVTITVKDGVATLSGYSSPNSKLAAERAATMNPEIERVVNLVTQS